MKHSLVNGTSTLLESRNPVSTHSLSGARKGSEPPQFSCADIVSFNLTSKDDAYDISPPKGKSQKGSISQAQNPVPKTLFDAKQLLDPKSFKTGQKVKDAKINHQTGDLSTHSEVNGVQKREIEELEGLGAGSMIERMHNVSKREDRPHKKQKTTDEEDKDKDSKSHFSGAGKGGILGEYVKEERQKGLESNDNNGAVDLTATGRLFFPTTAPSIGVSRFAKISCCNCCLSLSG